MKQIKAIVLVALGSLALARVASPVHAQITQADAAAFAEFKKTCSAEIAKMKATLVSVGEPISDAEFDKYFRGVPAELREAAKFGETRADAAFYREMGARVREEAAKPNNPDKGAVILAPVSLCYLDVLIRRETGAPASTSRPGPSSATKPAATGAAADSGSSGTVDCVRLHDKPGAFKNDCDFKVYFTYCGVNPGKDSWVAECSTQSYGLLDIGPKAVQGGFTRAERLYFFECKAPKIPQDVEFRDGKGLYGHCK